MKRRRFFNFNDAVRYVDDGRDRHLLRNFNFMNDGQPPSVKRLAECLGFDVELRMLPRGVSGYLESEPFAPKGFKIIVNMTHAVTRRRWTVLHEIAHYYLHPRFRDLLSDHAYRASLATAQHFYATDEQLVEEKEANEWVEAVVFEQNALKAMLSLYNGRKDAIAKAFGVSESSLDIVLKKRGL